MIIKQQQTQCSAKVRMLIGASLSDPHIDRDKGHAAGNVSIYI